MLAEPSRSRSSACARTLCGEELANVIHITVSPHLPYSAEPIGPRIGPSVFSERAIKGPATNRSSSAVPWQVRAVKMSEPASQKDAFEPSLSPPEQINQSAPLRINNGSFPEKVCGKRDLMF
jgi:hypothetical protein